MKKSKKIFIALLIIIAAVAVFISAFRFIVIKSSKTGFIVYGNETLNIYSLKSNNQTTYSIEGYTNLHDVGEYFGGDFCCIGDKSDDSTSTVLLFKDGALEKEIPTPYQITQVAAFNDDIYFKSDGQVYALSKINNEYQPIINNIGYERFYLNSKGDIAYLRNETGDIYSDDLSLYCYSDGKENKLGITSGIRCWFPDGTLLVRTRENFEAKTIYGFSYWSETTSFFIDIEKNIWSKTDTLENCVDAAALSTDGNNAICWFFAEGSSDFTPLGINNLKLNVKSEWTLTNDILINHVPFYFLWLDENPLENTSDNRIVENR